MVDITLETMNSTFSVSNPSIVSQEVVTSTSTTSTATATTTISSNTNGDGGTNTSNSNSLSDCLSTSSSTTSSSLLALSSWTLLYSFISTTVSKATDRIQSYSAGEHAPVFMNPTSTLSPDSNSNSNNNNTINVNNGNDIHNNNLPQPSRTSKFKSKRQLPQQIASSSIENSSLHKSSLSSRLRNFTRPVPPSTTLPTSSFSSLMKTKTLILDLDETLIHSTSRGSRTNAHMIEVMVDKHACLYYVYKRPHVDHFLKKVSEWYKVVIFTASMPEYADPVIDWLDPSKKLISSRYFRQSCTNRNGAYVKDLTIIEQDLSKVCLIDNSPISYSMQQENGIPIAGWMNDPNDEALLDLLPFLDALRFTEDVRSVLSLGTIGQ